MRNGDTQRIQIDIVVPRERCLQERVDVLVDPSELLVPFIDIGQHRFNVGFLGLLFAKLALRGVCLRELGLGSRFGLPSLLHSARQGRVFPCRLTRSAFTLTRCCAGSSLHSGEESSTRHA
jgi:hypothetical protein